MNGLINHFTPSNSTSTPSIPTHTTSHPPPTNSNVSINEPILKSSHLWSQRFSEFITPYFTLWRSTWDIKLTSYSILWFLICTYIVCLANSTVDRVNPNSLLPPDQRKVLPDLLLRWSMKVFVDTGLPRDLSDIWVRIATALLFARALTMKKYSMTILRRILFISGTIYLMRAPTVLLTVLPNPYIECLSHPNPNIFVDAIDLMLQRRYSCGDVFFSGHSIFITLVARIYSMYTNYTILHILAWIFTLGGLFSLVFTTYHYSIDVIFAFTIVSTFYSICHWCAKGKMGVNRWWGRIVLYLDGERLMDQEEGLLPVTTNTTQSEIPLMTHHTDSHNASTSPLLMVTTSVALPPTSVPIPISTSTSTTTSTSAAASTANNSSSSSPRLSGGVYTSLVSHRPKSPEFIGMQSEIYLSPAEISPRSPSSSSSRRRLPSPNRT